MLSSFFSARHFAKKDIFKLAADSAICRSKTYLSAGGLDTIVVVNSTGQEKFNKLNIKQKIGTEIIQNLARVLIAPLCKNILRKLRLA